jgi:pSer/pThr/pTyr-binding forkhead associated (FHA) protein
MEDIPVLVCTGGALVGARIAVPDGGLKMGRSDENHVVIDDEGVSRFHATLLYDNGQLWLQDAGSRNGVFVNGIRMTGHRALKVGDVMAIGEHTFAVRWASEAPEEAEGGADSGDEDRPRKWFWPFS